MNFTLKILATLLVANEARGVLNVVINGPRAVIAAWHLDFVAVANVLSYALFIGAGGFAVTVIVRQICVEIERSGK